MRRVILSIAVSLDGFIARPDGNLDWFLSGDDFEVEMLALLRSVDALLFGRVAYELLASYWPSAGTQTAGEAPGGFTSKEREREFARLMNETPKVVFSKTLAKANWGPVTLIRENIAEEISRMKQQPGKDLVLFAGAGIASTFMNLDLLDEYRLVVHPIVLGQGIPLVKDVRQERNLKLKAARTLTSGLVILQYTRDRGPTSD
jgi:dihydrofolate reductase